MKLIRLTETELSHIIRRVIQTEQDTEDTEKEEKINLIMTLRNFAKGKINANDLYYADESIDNIKVDNPLGQSLITIKIDDERKFFENVGLDEQDVWFYQSITGYNGYDFMDSYQVEQDFKDGYNVFYELNTENRETLKDIAEIIIPDKNFNLDDEEYRIELSNLLLELFPNEIEDILGDYGMEKNNEMTNAARNGIEEEFFNPLESNGIYLNTHMDEITISVADLLMSLLQSNLWNEPLEESLIKIIQQKLGTTHLGGWYENSYEYQDSSYFDDKSFNDYVKYKFDSIEKRLGEENEEFYTVRDYVEFKKRLSSKFKFKTWYGVPKNENILFYIEFIDFSNMSVNLNIKDKENGLFKKLKLSEDDFNNFLYQYSLDDLEDSE